MNKLQKISFVRSLSSHMTESIVLAIKEDKIPENWDGVELRQLMADTFSCAVFKGVMSKKRKAEYNNHCLINNL